MRKFMTFLWLMAMAVFTAQGAPVQKAKALSTAKMFLQKRDIRVVGALQLAYTEKRDLGQEERPYYYVLNNGDNEGFVIVSGDDRTEQILGYSDRGSFDPENIPDNMRAWLQGYVDQMAYLDQHRVAEKQAISGALPTRNAVQPILKAHWTQNAPFNNLTPVTTSNDKHTPVGCVATAMAQVMYHHKHPAKVLADIPSYTVSNTNITPRTQDGIPAGTVIDWDNMLDVYHGSETEAQKNAVAALSRYCGVAVGMSYAAGGSSANTSKIPKALINYFGYDSGILLGERKNYSYGVWATMLYDELIAGRPVIYAGQSSGGGHAFVVDGYDGADLFHVNWGWNNGCDGYFLLSVLNPGDNSGTGASSSSDGYNMDEEAIFGVVPASGGQTETKPVGATITMNSVDGKEVNCTVLNSQNETHTLYARMGYYDAEGNLHYASNSVSSNLRPQYYFNYSFIINITTPGDYILFPISNNQGNGHEWVVTEHSINYVDCHVANDGTITLVLHPQKNLTATFDFAEPKMVGVSQTTQVTVNNLAEEYQGALYFFASTSSSNKGSYLGRSGLSLLSGQSMVVEQSFLPNVTGTWYVWATLDEGGNEVIGSSSVVIGENISTSDPTALTATISLENVEGNKIYGNQVRGVMSYTNNSNQLWTGSLSQYIYAHTEPTGTFSGVYSQSESYSIQPGATLEVSFSYQGEYNLYYLITTKSGDDELKRVSPTKQLVPGRVTYLGDGSIRGSKADGDIVIGEDEVAVDLRGIDMTSITSFTPNNNPNTLYYFSEGVTPPTSLANSNVVLGDEAAKITLTDGRDFYVPLTFTALSISYSRIPTLLTDGTGYWETLALPFDVKNITLNGQPISFFTSGKDKGKDFWVRYFSHYEGTNMIFGFTDKMKAYVPYIVAFPGDKWGAQYSFEGKTVTFSGENAILYGDGKISSGSDYYCYTGALASTTVNNAYALDEDGKIFELNNSYTVPPFHAYIRPMVDTSLDADNLANTLYIFTDEATSIQELSIEQTPLVETPAYNLSGQKVNDNYKGIIVRNGRKYLNQ